jgi:hypothetical protein
MDDSPAVGLAGENVRAMLAPDAGRSSAPKRRPSAKYGRFERATAIPASMVNACPTVV